MQRNRRGRRGARGACGALALLAAGCAGSATTTATTTTAATATIAGSTGGPTTAAVSTTVSSTATSAGRATSTAATTVPATTVPATTVPATTQTTTQTTPAAATAPAAGATGVVVDSTPEQYFVLYVKPVLADDTEIPVAIARGQAGTTTLSDGRAVLPGAHYRVATFSAATPGDVDADGVDDLTELADPDANPLNAAPSMDAATGAVRVLDVETYQALSYQGPDVGRDSYLAGLEVMKFIIVGANTDHPAVYFMNTNNHKAHPVFASTVGIPGVRGGPSAGVMRGDVVYEPERVAADGSKGVYRFAFQPNDAYTFAEIALAYEVLTTNMPFLEGDLSYYAFPNAAYPLYVKEKASYDAYRVAVIRGA